VCFKLDDDYNDFVFGAPGTAASTGVAYVIFGGNNLQDTNLLAIDSNEGMVIDTSDSNANLGWVVAGAGDFNGDNVNDLLIGSPYSANGAGTPYVVFGTASKNSSSNSLSTGVIVVIVAGSIAVLILIATAVYCLLFKKSKPNMAGQQEMTKAAPANM
jgi:hypothetical protein